MSASAVRSTLAAVTRPVPKRSTTRTDIRLDTIVPAEMIIVTAPTHERLAPSDGAMAGHAEPMAESGRPSATNAR